MKSGQHIDARRAPYPMSPTDWRREAGASVAVSGQPRTLLGRVWQRLKADLPVRFTLAFLLMGIIITFITGLLARRWRGHLSKYQPDHDGTE